MNRVDDVRFANVCGSPSPSAIMPPRRSAVRGASPRNDAVSPPPARGKAAGSKFFSRHGNVYLYVPNLIGASLTHVRTRRVVLGHTA
jgi:hypothetical protein